MGALYNKQHGDAGKRQSSLYKRWCAIKARCTNPNDRSFKNYGGRGITLHKSWFDYKNFKKWAIIAGFREELWIDRIDNNSGYSPKNCRWTTCDVSANNKRQRSRLLTVRGRTQEMRDWAKEMGHKGTGHIRQRLYAGWDEERAVLYPVSKQGEAPKKSKLNY